MAWVPTTAPAMPERSGGEVLRELALGQPGPGRRLMRSLRDWSLAATAVVHEGTPGHFPLDISPGRFAVTEDGVWVHQTPGPTIRFALPAGVLGLEALLDAVIGSAVWLGLLSDLPTDARVRDAVGPLQDDLGLARDDAVELAWVEFRSDLCLRLGASDAPRDELRRQMRARLDMPLVALAQGLPMMGRLRAALWAASAPSDVIAKSQREAALEGEVASLETELRSTKMELERSASEVVQLREDRLRRIRHIKALRARLERQTRLGDPRPAESQGSPSPESEGG